MAQALPFIGKLIGTASTVSSIYNATQSTKTPKLQKPKEQADPNSLLEKRKKERSLAARYGSGSEASELESNTLG